MAVGAVALLLAGDAEQIDDELPATSACRDTFPASRSTKLQKGSIPRNASSSSVSSVAGCAYLRHGSELPAVRFSNLLGLTEAAARLRVCKAGCCR